MSKKVNDKYIFNINDYDVVRTINKGGFGIINLVRNKNNGKEYAAKTNLIQSKAQNKRFISREVRILMQVQHPTIVRFRGFSYVDFHGDKNLTILMDYMKEGSLAHLIYNESKGLSPPNFDNTNRQIILVGIARGMMVLHSKNVIHRDLKPENILLDSNFRPVITDFGLSKFFDPDNSSNQSVADSGTAQYMAPEVIVSDHYNTKADVFAFGILMYEVISGKRAYYELLHGKKRINVFQLKTKVKEGLRPSFDFPIKKGLKLMIEKCWSQNPKERPTFQELFKKLSLTNEDYYLEFEENQAGTIIIDNDNDNYIKEKETEFSNKYCLDNVNTNDLLDYVDNIMQEAISLDKESESDKQIHKENKKLKKQIKELSEKVASLEAELEIVKKEKTQQGIGSIFSAELNLKSPGIICHLKEKQKNPFDRLFVLSQSFNDVYNLLVPNIKDRIYSSKNGDYFVDFEFENPITISGAIIFSSASNFPRAFSISADDKIMKTINDAADLNGEYKNMTVNFDPIQCKKIRFKQEGPNWNKNSNYIYLSGIELLSNDPKYSKGVFATFVEESENKDTHKCPVIVSSNYFDYSNIYQIDVEHHTSQNGKNAWFQIELTRGFAILKGFRLKRTQKDKLKSYKIICTDDSSKPEDSWIKMFEIDEKSENEHELLDIYEFKHPSPLVRFIRIVLTGPTWSDSNYIKFFHFDVFGCYF